MFYAFLGRPGDGSTERQRQALRLEPGSTHKYAHTIPHAEGSQAAAGQNEVAPGDCVVDLCATPHGNALATPKEGADCAPVRGKHQLERNEGFWPLRSAPAPLINQTPLECFDLTRLALCTPRLV